MQHHLNQLHNKRNGARFSLVLKDTGWVDGVGLRGLSYSLRGTVLEESVYGHGDAPSVRELGTL